MPRVLFSDWDLRWVLLGVVLTGAALGVLAVVIGGAVR